MIKFMRYMKPEKWYGVGELYAIQHEDCGVPNQLNEFYNKSIMPLVINKKLKETYHYPIRLQRRYRFREILKFLRGERP